MANLVDIATKYAAAGLSVIPATQDKIPALKEWASFQQKIADPKRLKELFSNNSRSIALIGGKVSGNVEMLDFDCQGEAFPAWLKLINQQAPGLFEKLYWEKTPSGGDHVIYRCPEIEQLKCEKLAKKAIEVNGAGEHTYKGKTTNAVQAYGKWWITPDLIETKAEGGYCLVAPSRGYTKKQGDLCNLSEVSVEERNLLINSALSFNEWVPPSDIDWGFDTSPKPVSKTSDGRRPGDDFNERGDIGGFLLKHSWVKTNSPGHVNGSPAERWRRPGKDKGWSASLIDGRVLYCFSDDAPPFEYRGSYAPFSAYALLEHNGDFTAAARALREMGYGTKPTRSEAQPVSVRQMLTKFSREVQWLWRTHFPKGLPVMIDGREGDGKSIFCIASAKEILRQHPEGSIVWLATEGAVQDALIKIVEQELDLDRLVIAEKSDETYKFNFTRKGDLKELDLILSKVRKPILCVFIDSIRGMSHLGDNDAILGPIMHEVNQVVCDRYKATLVYIDHHGKGEKKDFRDKNAGTTAKRAAVRIAFSVMPASKYKRDVRLAKTNFHEISPDLETIKTENEGLIVIRQPSEEAPETIIDKAEKLLIQMFEPLNFQGEILAKEGNEKAKEKGFEDWAMSKARNNLGIISTNSGFGTPWVWKWPAEKSLDRRNDQTREKIEKTGEKNVIKSTRLGSLVSPGDTDKLDPKYPPSLPSLASREEKVSIQTSKHINNNKKISDHAVEYIKDDNQKRDEGWLKSDPRWKTYHVE